MSRHLIGRALVAAALVLQPGVPYADGAPTGPGEEEPAPLRTRYLLVGPDGGAVTDEDFRGRFQLITFGYTFCPDICPTTLLDMAEVLRILGDAPLQAIFITVDPQRDTRDVLGNYTRYFDPRILGLGGSPELVARAAANFKVRYARVDENDAGKGYYSVDHSAGLYLLGKDGEFLRKFGYGTPAARIADEILSFIADE
ncbi:SCO family protein [Pseudothauera rhizosphaerae]|uniref:SCO family protein n=1 Tax=Pseudothauera rhizosphaerae TaxID=2565932 RepID=A0A4S4AN04_9RHOO|nr:SCO family protein [Pseudothauera rhizosphaerae]THF61001.1 SCO family protein [Pseudothauera rhizosphaerae]